MVSIIVELDFIAHLCTSIQSSIALSKSKPFTWCVLTFPNGPSYSTLSTVFSPPFFVFFSPHKSFAQSGD